jgi:hypothetical protein
MSSCRLATARLAAAMALSLVAPLAAITPADPPAADDAFAPYLAATADGAVLTWLEPVAAAAGADAAAPPRVHRVRFARWAGGEWSATATIVESADVWANWADTPGVAQAADGALVAWWLARNGESTYAYGVRVARSTDGGATWSELGWLHDDLSPTEHGFVSMAADPAGLRAFWLDGRATAQGRPMTLRTATIGAAVAASELVDDTVCDCCSTAALAVGGTHLVAYRDRTAEEIRDVRVATVAAGAPPRSTPAGRDGWKIEGCPVNGPALARTGELVAVAWFGAPGDRGHVAAALSSDGGATFGEPVEVDSAQPLGRVALAPMAAGEFALAWHARAGDAAEIRLVRLGVDGAMGAPLALARTSGGRRSGFARLAAAGDGALLVAWTEVADGPSRLRAARVAPAELPRP